MLPDGAHLRAEDWTIFCLNQMIPDPEHETNGDEKPLLYVLNLVRTKHDATARRFVGYAHQFNSFAKKKHL
jgi:hypothetical protein